MIRIIGLHVALGMFAAVGAVVIVAGLVAEKIYEDLAKRKGSSS